MPVGGEFHTFYWENSDTVVPPVRISKGGYPAWQSAVVLGSGLGGAALYWEAFCDWIGWACRLIRRSHRYDLERRAIVLKALDALEHPSFPTAQKAVRKTAVTLGFNRAESWKDLSREIKSDPGRAENAFRHLEAMRLLRVNNVESTLSNPHQNLIVELAYQGFTVTRK